MGRRKVSKAITEFRDDNFFLSNFYPCTVVYGGYTFQNTEAAFQASKCPERMSEFCDLNPSEAKRLGRRVKLRPDWEEVKDGIMLSICYAKFRQNPELHKRLLETGNAELVEGNDWGDTVWGVCNGVGENRLGKILMSVRRLLESDPIRCPECRSTRVFMLRIDSDWETGLGEYYPVNYKDEYTAEELNMDACDRPDIEVFHCRECGHIW